MKGTKKKSPAGKVRGPSQSERTVPLQEEKKKEKKPEKLGKIVLIADSRAVSRRQEVTALTKREAVLREEKVRRVKAQLAQGTYQVNAKEVAKAIVRSEMSQLLSEERGGKKS
jgi:anti-sigma28 factor (negative regulator of flagellin synthesis)